MVYGSIADIFYQWESLGIFDFILPFLLVFAIVFGILSSTKFMGENKGVYVIIAFVIGLMSLRYRYFLSGFLSELFPRLGIGLAMLFALLILVGLFIAKDESRYWGYGLAAIGAIIGIVIIYQAAESMGWYWASTGYGSDAVGFIVLAILIIGVIIAVAVSGEKGGNAAEKKKRQALGEAIFGPWRS